jgi:hypothetical protein
MGALFGLGDLREDRVGRLLIALADRLRFIPSSVKAELFDGTMRVGSASIWDL